MHHQENKSEKSLPSRRGMLHSSSNTLKRGELSITAVMYNCVQILIVKLAYKVSNYSIKECVQ